MATMRARSLGSVLDRVHASAFFGERLSRQEREEIAAWIVGRQGLPGSYAGMFAPTPRDLRDGVRVFTGEHVGTGAGPAQERRLASGLRALRSRRDGSGRWRRFPFYYTLLALSEIELPEALREIRYVATACERALRSRSRDAVLQERRRTLLERILARA